MMDEARQDLWNLIEDTPQLDWLILTKRPQNIQLLTPDRWRIYHLNPRNIWWGVSVGHAGAVKRINELVSNTILMRSRETVLFLSIEPQTEFISWRHIEELGRYSQSKLLINWIICGGESGGGKRPFDIEWARYLMQQSKAAGVPFFMKQIDKIEAIPPDLMVREFPAQNYNFIKLTTAN